ncbi:hypothetical protein G4V62_06140 [Bacillaceae bacterium SIJ1]|uniref:hypothetical protein n=1 Tax=Litoribacterium kuwaitense TaxID=1398745 RepID=UPI0013EB75C2|nr:hypothetical protein [Litoribacterium kuwaitense]NGP44557.1 hypothetical protein [Litoribacterium kuwaitense]
MAKDIPTSRIFRNIGLLFFVGCLIYLAVEFSKGASSSVLLAQALFFLGVFVLYTLTVWIAFSHSAKKAMIIPFLMFIASGVLLTLVLL